MPNTPISLDEASWRLEQSEISGRAFAELLVKSELLLFGLSPGNELHDPVDLSGVTSLQAEPENVVVAGDVRWTDIKLNWSELRAAFETRGRRVSWNSGRFATTGAFNACSLGGSAVGAASSAGMV
jgi:hypothetical protein